MNAALIGILQVLVLQGLWCSQPQKVAAVEPILALDAQYIRESDAIRNDSKVDRNAFAERWLARFKEVLEENPDSKNVGWARGRVTELLNGLERYRESLEMLNLRLRDASTEWERIHYTNQIGEVARGAYYVEKDPALARKSIDSFRKVRAMLPQPGVNGIVALDREGELLGRALGKHDEAAEAYMLANDWLPKLTEDQRVELGDSANSEQLLGNATMEFAKAEKPDRALATLQKLEELEGRRFSTAHYLIQLTGVDRSGAGDVYREFAEKWLNQHRDDPMAFDLTYDLAFQNASRDNMPKAIKLYEQLLNNADQSKLDQPRQETLARAKRYLGELYIKTQQPDKARQLELRSEKQDK